VFPNELIEDRPALGETIKCANFVRAHEAAIAFDICCEDRDEASAD
jgi:hypothetical protein